MTPDRIERYRLTREVLQEKYATVYEALNEKNSQPVYLSLYPANFFTGEVMHNEFESRGAVLNRMSDPTLLPIYQFGSYGESPYVVSPVMEGGSLAEKMVQKGKLTPAEIVPIVDRVANALDALHAQKVIHGNLTPDSVWFNVEDVAYLGGFIMPPPTPDQMSDLSWYSPEYLKGKTTNRQSDIYSLTALTYNMLTGVTPFFGKTSSEISHLLLQNEIPSVAPHVDFDDEKIEELDRFFELGLNYVVNNRPLFASELINRFKYIFRISVSADLTVTQSHESLHDNQLTQYNIVALSETSADFDEIPDWMFTFDAPKVKIQGEMPVPEKVDDIEEEEPAPVWGSSAPTEHGRNKDQQQFGGPDLLEEKLRQDSELSDTNVFEAGDIATEDETGGKEKSKSKGRRKFNARPAPKKPDVKQTQVSVQTRRKRGSLVATTLVGLISLFALGAIVLFGLAVFNVIRQPDEPGEVVVLAEGTVSGEAEAGAGDPAAEIEPEIDPSSLLTEDIPAVAGDPLSSDSYVWEYAPPSSTFLRRSRSTGFSLEEAGWYMYSNANTIRDVVRIENRIYAASGAGLTVWDLDAGNATRLTSYDGLVGNDINQIVYCELPEPKLLIASESGLGILDLNTLENEIFDVKGRQLINNQVSSVACESAGDTQKIYVGYTNDGLTIHDLVSGKRDRIDRSDGLPTDAVEQILLVDQTIWINTGSGLLHFNTVTGETESFNKAAGTLPSQNISEMAWDSDGTGLVWMATNDGLMVGNSRGEFTLYTDENTNLPRGLGKSMSIDPAGYVWYGTSFGSMCAFSTSTLSCEKIYRHPAGEFELEGAITALDVAAGTLVYGHRRDGVRIGTLADDSAVQAVSWQPLVVPNQFPVNEITTLAEADGFVWIGTRRGLYKAPLDDFTGETWEYLDTQNSDLPANWITKLFPDPEGGMWVGTFRGAIYFGDVWLEEPIMIDQQIRAIARDGREANIWLGTNKGVFQYDGRAVAEMRDLPTINVRTLNWVNGELYIGAEDGRIGILTGGVFNVLDRNSSQLSADPIGAIESGPNGTLYVGNGDDLFVLNEALELTQIPQVRGYYISDVAFQNRTSETLVATTSNSLFYYDSIDWQQITVRDGLPTERILEMMIDSRGTLWLAGQSLNEEGGGLVRYVPFPFDTEAEEGN